MIDNAEISLAIGYGPSEKPEWWELCHPADDLLYKVLGDKAQFWGYIGPDFREWGPQTGIMIEWMRSKIGPFEAIFAHKNTSLSRYTPGEAPTWGQGDDLPLALCEAVMKARDTE